MLLELSWICRLFVVILLHKSKLQQLATNFFDDKGAVSVIASNDSIAVGGNAHNINLFKAIQEMIEEVVQEIANAASFFY